MNNSPLNVEERKKMWKLLSPKGKGKRPQEAKNMIMRRERKRPTKINIKESSQH